VLPSLGEGSGSMSLIEALEAGRPVVASACDGVPEDVTDGQSALLVPPGSVDGLAAGLARLLGDEPLRRRLARGARETFAARFSPAGFVEARRATYADLGLVVPAPDPG
jgi:glycosyltransferase involved in cell wall biosynthesis